jgi:hypothetical protein
MTYRFNHTDAAPPNPVTLEGVDLPLRNMQLGEGTAASFSTSRLMMNGDDLSTATSKFRKPVSECLL